MSEQEDSKILEILRQNQTACNVCRADIEALKVQLDKTLTAFHSGTMEVAEKVAEKICSELRALRTELVQPATAVGKIDLKVVMPVIYTLCGVITALIIWFTGVEPNLPEFFGMKRSEVITEHK